MSSKLNHLIATWPNGAVRTISALKKGDYSQALLHRYRQSGWLTSIGDNAVFRTGDEISVLSGLYALQEDLELNVHLGGRSALEFQGFAHYLRNERAELTLFGQEARLPKWFVTYRWRQKVRYRASNLFPKDFSEGLVAYRESGFQVQVSSPARAMSEYLSLVPGYASVEEGKELMAGLAALRPDKVQRLLEVCRSVKVKRLFLLLAEECRHAWVRRVAIDSIDLGVGPRNLTPGGKLHKKYRITVPTSILSGEGL
jgi:hypothetical protein